MFYMLVTMLLLGCTNKAPVSERSDIAGIHPHGTTEARIHPPPPPPPPLPPGTEVFKVRYPIPDSAEFIDLVMKVRGDILTNCSPAIADSGAIVDVTVSDFGVHEFRLISCSPDFRQCADSLANAYTNSNDLSPTHERRNKGRPLRMRFTIPYFMDSIRLEQTINKMFSTHQNQ